MEKIVEQSRANGIKVEEVCGDTAYSSKGNMEYARENGIKLISRPHQIVSNGAGTAARGFEFNKDAGTFRCPAGHLAAMRLQSYFTAFVVNVKRIVRLAEPRTA